MKESTYTQSSWVQKDQQFEATVRPQALIDFMGQSNIQQRLKIVTQAAKERKESLHHTLFYGPPGLGKTTLANILAKEMGARLVVTSGPTLEKAGDLAGILTNLEEGDILFIDEIHRLNRAIEEYLYPAMEDFSLDLMLDSGANARSVQVKLNRFTLVGATTRLGLISAPMRSRFGLSMRLDYYDPETLAAIILRSAKILSCSISPEGALEIGRRSRGTPRIANNLLKWVRDYNQIHHKGKEIGSQVVKEALDMLSIDEKGLDEMDKKLLSIIIDHHDGGPVGLKTLAAAIGEEADSIEEVYEPFLIMQGFLKRTPRGRQVTDLAINHLRRS